MRLPKYLKKGFVSLLFGSLFGIFTANAETTTITVFNKSGKLQNFELKSSGKVFFNNNELVILPSYEENRRISLELAEIEKLFFYSVEQNSTGESGASSDYQNQALSVFPNPTNDYVYISDVQENCMVEIYSWNGMLINNQKYSVGKGVSLADYPIGLYTLRVDGRTFKIYKK